MRICEYTEFNLEDFSFRWRKARLAALRSLPIAPDSSAVSGGRPEPDTFEAETDLVLRVPEELRETALKNVFDNSRRLGLSVSRFLGMSFEISDFSEILAGTQIPCYRGHWRVHNQARVLEREGCESVKKLGSFGCDYWREALDGLVMGAGDNERLARHRSLGHGNQTCVDVLFSEEFSIPRVVQKDAPAGVPSVNRHGPVPQEISREMASLSERFAAMKVLIHLDGFSEGVLYYRLEASEGVLCGAGGKMLHDWLCRHVVKRFPNIAPKDASPLAVYGGST